MKTLQSESDGNISMDDKTPPQHVAYGSASCAYSKQIRVQ
jgi:hypothetical protein